YIDLIFFFQAEDGIRDFHVTGVQTCALPIWFQSLARTFNAPTIATLQTGHQVDARNSKCPILQDVPGDWGFIADTIITLYRDDRSEERRVGKGVELGGRRKSSNNKD